MPCLMIGIEFSLQTVAFGQQSIAWFSLIVECACATAPSARATCAAF